MKTQNLPLRRYACLLLLFILPPLHAQDNGELNLKRDEMVTKYEARGFSLLTNLESGWKYSDDNNGYVITFIHYGRMTQTGKGNRQKETTLTLIINVAGRVVSKEKRSFIRLGGEG